jgi:L,D-peptidoglycan transpeptidase YkuD (ErfK/YbiS/YcfS/YnhG family)
MRRRTLLVAGTVGALGLAAAIMTTFEVLESRAKPATAELAEADRLLTQARSAGAAEWVPAMLTRAEASLRSRRLEHRRQELRLWPLRNFGPVRDSIRIAHALAAEALAAAEERRSDARGSAMASVAWAAATLAPLAGAESVGLDRPTRRLIADARLKLAQARELLAAGSLVAARRRADEASGAGQRATEALLEATNRFRSESHLAEWRRWERETVDWSRREGKAAVVVYKDEHRLTLFEAGRAVRTWTVDLGPNSIFDKSRRGDRATPEGRYRITAVKGRGQSRYYKALLLDYPNLEDRRRFEDARRAGLVARDAGLGGLIEVHGEGGRGLDWTDGCVALSNAELDQLFQHVRVGTPVTIVGAGGRGGMYSDLDRLLREGREH